MKELSIEQIAKFDRVIKQLNSMLQQEEFTEGEFAALMSMMSENLKGDSLYWVFQVLSDRVVKEDVSKIHEYLAKFEGKK